jgi:RNA polymerase sigma factor (TIGR02999 family)
LELVYPELRKIAAAHMARERPGHTLQPTALVNEAYLKMARSEQGVGLQNRAHFFAAASILMRRILVDHARKAKAAKRPRPDLQVEMRPDLSHKFLDPGLVLDVDRALEALERLDKRQAQVVEMRFFGGLTEEEIASVVRTSVRTVKRDWVMGKAWLNGFLSGQI